MSESSRQQELEFELAVAGHLEEECGLAVHIAGDVLNRRRSGYATLQFQYSYPSGPGGRARVRISVAGSAQQSRSVSVNLRDPDEVAKTLPMCEELAPHIRAHLAELPDPSLPPAGLGRREDDSAAPAPPRLAPTEQTAVNPYTLKAPPFTGSRARRGSSTLSFGDRSQVLRCVHSRSRPQLQTRKLTGDHRSG